jgi:SAM-dependent methyltransferase
MHREFYQKNERYADRLRDSDPRHFQSLPQVCPARPFHEKYERALRAGSPPGSALLDVGCGVGQVVRSLAAAGFQARGVEISEPSLALAREQGGDFYLYDGTLLPFPDRTFAAVGACNVLEHVENPLGLLDEMTRVLRPGGRLVLSSPNFRRVFGWRDYHPQMRGVAQKWRNAKTILRHLRRYAADSRAVLLDPMPLINREPFQPDDDAIVATNPIDLSRCLATRAYQKIEVSCVDRPVPRWLEFLLDLTPLRYVILNSFITAEKGGVA